MPRKMNSVYQTKMQQWNEREHQERLAWWESQRSLIMDQYVNGDLSQHDLAVILGITQQPVSKWLKILGIPAKSRNKMGEQHWMWRGGQERRPYRKLIVKDICSSCQATEKLLIHHKDFDHLNNTLENLQILCNPCHLSLHKKAWWQGQRTINSPNGWQRSQL